ncbi:transposase [candidate division KSB1 bacterium]|nr:transposase [candidate division KSB1 bacterium]
MHHFGASLNGHIHFHYIVTDGVFLRERNGRGAFLRSLFRINLCLEPMFS